ncbi:MAG TPA: hypothetical protein VFW17_00750 [Ktedonobacterales bacterium]|nr:hypothetical protein [Ktedonobacterales bacterium]
MRVRSLRWMAQASVVFSCLVLVYFGIGAVIEFLANAGAALVGHDSWLWVAFHPGLAVYITGLLLMAIVAIVSWLARHALRRRASSAGTSTATPQDSASA